ncbi:MAG TPA: sn-glycerol-1-phosphate dehydrogenase [Dongiaceae bacterium]
MARWTSLIDDMVAGRWTNPETGKLGTVPYKMVVIEERLDGAEAALVRKLGFAGRLAVVSDQNTHDIMGRRIESALQEIASIDSVVLDHPHADEEHVARVKDRLRHADAVVAVGSGTINDLCKYVTALDGRSYCVFGTAPSMNGYTSTTASLTQPNGLKISKPAHAPKGVFIDLAINAAAPTYLIASGFGDCLVRSVAQVDCWLSKAVMGTPYSELPFQLEMLDEAELMKRAAGLAKGDVEAVGYLHRVLTLCGFGVSFTGTTNHGSMGEHQISHYIDCFAGDRHPGTLHGQQVGVASLTMARLQARLLASDKPPVISPTRIDEADMRRRFGEAAAQICRGEMEQKAFDPAGADRLNARLESIWPELRAELTEFTMPVQEMQSALVAAGGPTTAAELGLDADFYREAICHAREIRRRYSALDLAADAGLLDQFAAGEG